MEVMKRSYLLLDSAGDNSVLIFLAPTNKTWIHLSSLDGDARRSLLFRTDRNRLSESTGIACRNGQESLV